VGVSQGSSGTDVPAFVNEKRCKKKEGDIGRYRSAATHPIGAQRRTLSERSDAPYRSAATHPIGAQRRSSNFVLGLDADLVVPSSFEALDNA